MNSSLEKKKSELLEQMAVLDSIQEQRALKEGELILKDGLYIEEIAN